MPSRNLLSCYLSALPSGQARLLSKQGEEPLRDLLGLRLHAAHESSRHSCGSMRMTVRRALVMLFKVDEDEDTGKASVLQR